MQRQLFTLPLVAVLLTGCSSVYVPSFVQAYQPDVQQGNIFEEAQVDRLYEGMPKSQVHSLLGTPSLEDIFHAGQRDTYVYYDKRGKKKAFRHTLVIEYNRSGRIASIRHDGMDLSQAPSMNSAELPDEAESPSPAAGASPDTPDAPYSLGTGDDTQLQTPPAQDPL